MTLDKKLKSFTVMLISFLAGVMFVLGGVTAYRTFFPTQEKTQVNISQATPASFATSKSGNTSDTASIVKAVSPAIVNIETISVGSNQELNPFFRDFYGRRMPFSTGPQVEEGMGSGFIINKDGYILTNEHVISNATEINVTVGGFDKPLKAKVIGSDADLDLAVIKIDAGKDLPFLTLGDSNKVNVGDWVIAIGNPYGLDHTVTMGVISAKGRPVTISSREYKNLLQTDAAINPGNSGGPLINMAGQVIGINTAVNAEAQGIGFAIPTDTVNEVLKDLIEKGKVNHPYMGIYMQSLGSGMAQYLDVPADEGVVVSNVVTGGPAHKAGLQRGDIILKVNDKPVKTVEELQELITKSKVNTKLVLEVFRDGQIKKVTVVLAAR